MKNRDSLLFVGLLVVATLAGIWGAQQVASQNEGDTGVASHINMRAGHFMVTAANPHATDAGYEILAAGGSAVDAAIAIEAVLSLTEPQSSGLAGGAYMLHWQAAKAQLDAYDGRETTPMGATPELFHNEDGQMGFSQPLEPVVLSVCPALSPCWHKRTATTGTFHGPISSSLR